MNNNMFVHDREWSTKKLSNLQFFNIVGKVERNGINKM